MNFFRKSKSSAPKENMGTDWNRAAHDERQDNLGYPDSFSAGRRDVFVQVEVPLRTMGTLTNLTEVRDCGVGMDYLTQLDSFTSMDPTSGWDAAIQALPATHDAESSPGEWNVSIMRGVDSQTDCPNPSDPLFWLTGSLIDIRKSVVSLISVMEEELGGEEKFISKDMLELKADNILLRIEVADLKRKLSQGPIASQQSETHNSRRSIPRKSYLAGLTGGLRDSSVYVVCNTEALPVTVSLAPSSTVLGYIRDGDRVISSGTPEDIGGCVRLPVLPRGWVTLRDPRSEIYLKSIINYGISVLLFL